MAASRPTWTILQLASKVSGGGDLTKTLCLGCKNSCWTTKESRRGGYSRSGASVSAFCERTMKEVHAWAWNFSDDKATDVTRDCSADFGLVTDCDGFEPWGQEEGGA